MMYARVAVVVGVALLAGCASNRRAGNAELPARDAQLAAELAAQGERAIDKEDWARAISLNREALRHHDGLGAAWHNLGIALMQTRENLEAASSFQRAAELLPTDPRPYENLALLHMNAGWHEDALRLYELSLERGAYHVPSLRGAVLAARELNQSTPAGLERVKRGILVEKDPAWRVIFEREQVRVAQDLAEREKASRRPN
ncbi:MAG: hypothetical protein SFY69_02260 [Planctomycetota bacterium]|nr:hypothetical protein [Planctomycetota bacterium]